MSRKWFDCINCGWSGESGPMRSYCPKCRHTIIGRERTTEDLVREVSALREALQGAEAENHLLRQELDQTHREYPCSTSPDSAPSSVMSSA